jgi:hypothetical protein
MVASSHEELVGAGRHLRGRDPRGDDVGVSCDALLEGSLMPIVDREQRFDLPGDP